MNKAQLKAAMKDPDIRREMRALRAAARDAKRLAEITGTPFII
jgi:hypothetical protein